MMFFRTIITIVLFAFYHTALATTNCDQEYSYYLDNDDKPDIIKFYVDSYEGKKKLCMQTLHLSESKTDVDFSLDKNSAFFDFYRLRERHKKDEIVVAYKRKTYLEVHHYKMRESSSYVQGSYIKSEPFIDTIDYIYPDKTLKYFSPDPDKTRHKRFEDIRWNLRHDIFVIRDKDSPDTRATFSKVKVHRLSNKQLFDIVEMGGGSSVISILLNKYRGTDDPYIALSLSKALKQFGMPNKSKEYYFNYLKLLANKKIKTPDPKLAANLKPESITKIFNKIPNQADIIDIALGDINQNGSLEAAIVYYYNKDVYLQVYEKEAETYKLKYTSQAMKNYIRHDDFEYHFDRDPRFKEKAKILNIEDGLLSFNIKGKGHAFTDSRRITVFFSLQENKLILNYTLNLWQKNNDLVRRYFVIDYKKGFIVDYPKYDDFNFRKIAQINSLLNNYTKFLPNAPIFLENFIFTDLVKNIFEKSYTSMSHYNFDEEFKQASQYYKNKQYYKILPLFNQNTIKSHFYSYSLSDINIAQYNDIAYFLQKANDHKNAIFILEKVIAYDSKRIVAYLNIADSYAAIGQHAQADSYYFDYLQKMQLTNKKNKIPQRLKQLDHGLLLTLSKNTKIVSILKSATGDLNGDKINDYVFALNMKKGKQLYVFLSKGKAYEKIFENTKTIENIENNGRDYDELTQILIKKGRLSLIFETEYFGEEVYQFKKQDKVFKLALQKKFHSGRMNSYLITMDYLEKTKTVESSFMDFSKNDNGEQVNTNKVEKLILDTNVTLNNFYIFRQKEISETKSINYNDYK